jgi:hypothetical protein
MTAAMTDRDPGDEAQLLDWDVVVWRHDRLVDAGCPVLLAIEVAPRLEIDLHEACELFAHGCSPELAARILL